MLVKSAKLHKGKVTITFKGGGAHPRHHDDAQVIGPRVGAGRAPASTRRLVALRRWPRRACVIVLDAVGAGELPDAAAYGDAGSSTLAARRRRGRRARSAAPAGARPRQRAAAARAARRARTRRRSRGRLREHSAGKDTTTGHWELMGVITETAMPTYPDGFPDDVIRAFSEATGRGVIGNVAASGTEIIERLGEEHQRTGDWIVYTSADSVFQVAAHEQTVPLEELYEACRIARRQLTGPHAVGPRDRAAVRRRPGCVSRRTSHRHDFSLEPTRPNHLTRIREADVPVVGVGKISDVFAGLDVTRSEPTSSNAEGIETTRRLLGEVEQGLIFANLVETDMLYGHRNDPAGVPPLPAGVRPRAAVAARASSGPTICWC